ncbi:MAG: peptidoglycan bridge formation glycyltransferase FemA/FemB family protein [Rickettsiales bacterium]|nr:peptidoglycan bridge formation glycyltransferase FemA/FemB family protein [Rickettsiales bacterium]
MNAQDQLSDTQIVWDTMSIADYSNLLKGHGYAYQQHPAYGEIVASYGGATHRAIITQAGQPIAYAQMHVRTFVKHLKIATVMRGPIWLRDDLEDAQKSACYRLIKKEHPLTWPYFLFLMPESNDADALNMTGIKRVVTPYHTSLVDLTSDEDTLLSSLDGKWRNQLRKAQQSELECQPVGLKPIQYEWLLMEEIMQQLQVGYAALSPKLVPEYQSLAGKDSLLILRADIGKETVAGVLCLIHGQCATYHIGWSSEDGKKLNAHNLLLWECMLRLKARGVTSLDLGGINTEDGAGLTRFKLGLGGRVSDMPGVYL